jgi:hypothetical protein
MCVLLFLCAGSQEDGRMRGEKMEGKVRETKRDRDKEMEMRRRSFGQFWIKMLDGWLLWSMST